MKKLLWSVLMLVSVPSWANEVVWECQEYTEASISMADGIAKNENVLLAKSTIVVNDEGYYTPASEAFPKEQYYFWLDPKDTSGKAVNANNVMVKDQDRFIIYVFQDHYTGKGTNDVVGYIALMNCTIAK